MELHSSMLFFFAFFVFYMVQTSGCPGLTKDTEETGDYKSDGYEGLERIINKAWLQAE